ncbi:MAG: RNA chaperone Hfq [Selenomonadales bacterium]|nr:RNA chaperone Hfq [Selenomonadales bacterium]MDD6217832.1 RNA chaperone Hfq [Selenomonadaceae bacterium]
MTAKVVNLQDSILNQVRKDNAPVVIHLMNGFQIKGYVKGFDSFTVIMDSMGKQMLVYKHAISTITLSQNLDSIANMNKADE